MSNISEKLSRIANSESIKNIKVVADTSDIKGALMEKCVIKEIYSVINTGSIDNPKKSYITMGAFIISYGDDHTLPDIRFGLSRCSPKDKFSLRQGMKMAKYHAFNSTKEYGCDWNFMNSHYWFLFDAFKAVIMEYYTGEFLGRPGLSTGIKTVTCHCKDIVLQSYFGDKTGVFSTCYHCGHFIPWDSFKPNNKRGKVNHFFKRPTQKDNIL